jgi:hypothetical protein
VVQLDLVVVVAVVLLKQVILMAVHMVAMA